MNKVIIDVSRLAGRLIKGRLPTGIDRVSLAYIAHFGDRAHAMVQIKGRTRVFSQEISRGIFTCLLERPPGFRRQLATVVARAFLRRWRPQAYDDAFMFNTGHSALHDIAFHRAMQQHGIKPIVVVHDLIPISHPEYCREGELAKHIGRMQTVLQYAGGVIANSQATLDELGAFARKNGRAVPPAAAALLGSGVSAVPSPVRPIAAPYFVVLATIEPRKNHWMLLQLWRKLIERHGDAAPRLVVIGQRGWECENVIDLLERCESLRGVVTELPRCSDADLATYLHHAQALLFPSFAEGYGMPVVEALALGTPIIASDLPVFREIAATIPDYLDPMDGLGWMARIEAYTAPDSPPRAAQLQRMIGYTPPSWPAHFAIVEALMERLR
jgi:glycosyltransferase involved in cell wall biosynthesis